MNDAALSRPCLVNCWHMVQFFTNTLFQYQTLEHSNNSLEPVGMLF